MPIYDRLGVPDCGRDILSSRNNSRVWNMDGVFLMSVIDEMVLEEFEQFISEQMEEYGYSFEEIMGVIEIAKIRLIQKIVRNRNDS